MASIASIGSNSSPAVAVPSPVPRYQVVRLFADCFSKPAPPVGALAKTVFWIQSVYYGVVWFVHYLFNAVNIEVAKIEMAAATTPEKIVEIALPFAKVLPDFAFLVIWYGGKSEKALELQKIWLARGHILFTDLSDGTIETAATSKPILESYADLLIFQAEPLNEHERIERAIQLLNVAVSSLRKENVLVVGNTVIEALYALFPAGIDPNATKFWSHLDRLIQQAKIVDGDSTGTLFDDYLLIFVKHLLRKGGAHGGDPMHAVRHHLLHSHQLQSEALLRYLASDKWGQFATLPELKVIREEVTSTEKLEPSTLLHTVLKTLSTSGNTELQPLIELYSYPRPWRDHGHASIARHYLGPLAIPTGTDGLFSAVFLSGSNRIVSHLFLDDAKVHLPPPLITSLSASGDTLSLFEESLTHLKKVGFAPLAESIKRQFHEGIGEWLKRAKNEPETLQTLTDLYQALLRLPVQNKTELSVELEYVGASLADRMNLCWKEACPKGVGIDYSKYRGQGLVRQVPTLIDLMKELQNSLI